MSKRSWHQVPLARKVSLLFGTAVLLVIAVTLWSPWLQMESLHSQTMLAQAQRLASVAYQAVDLRQNDWLAAQRELDRRWPLLARDLHLGERSPRLIKNQRGLPRKGFRYEALSHLTDHPDQPYYWKLQDDRRSFRFGLAVRAADADPHPSALLGLIDVELPMRAESGIWNSVVTILAGASGAVLAILVFYMVTQRLVLSPVHDLRRVAEQVALGNTEVRSEIATGDEFQKLSKTFNEMLAHLCAAQDEQRKINRSLDIRLGELAETNVALYESNRLKGEFLANVTHELRTPLVSIIGFAELLRDAWDSENPDPKRMARYSENIRTSGRSLLEIINDLLDLVKLEAGKMGLHLSEFCLATLCQELVDFVRPLADKQGHTLTLNVSTEIKVRSDSGKIKQILYNLLSNAIKFTPDGGCVSLDVAGNAGEFSLTVKDTGPGIAAEDQQLIFEKFRQLDASETREVGGTGLGLAITRDLVSLLGGTIELSSASGEGATFVVRLPTRLAGEGGDPEGEPAGREAS